MLVAFWAKFFPDWPVFSRAAMRLSTFEPINKSFIARASIHICCQQCDSKDNMEETSIAGFTGEVFTFTLDQLAGRSDDPVVVQTVASMGEDKVRFYGMMTDCVPEEVTVGLPVGLTFRRIYEGAGMHNYFWKLRPLENRLKELEATLEKVMGERHALDERLADPNMYSDEKMKEELQRTLIEQKKLSQEEAKLLNEWDDLSQQIETISKSLG